MSMGADRGLCRRLVRGVAGEHRPLVDRLNQSLAKVLQLPDVRSRLTSEIGIEPAHSTPEDFGKFIAAEIEKWTKVVKSGNITVN